VPLLDREAAKEVILEMASKAQGARIYTYSFRVSHWVEDLLLALPTSDVYISCPADLQRLPYELPEYLHYHRFHKLSGSHMKAYVFKNRGGAYSGVMGSLNAVETTWVEYCYRVTTPEARHLWDLGDQLESEPYSLQERRPEAGIEFLLDGSRASSMRSATRRILQERINAALSSGRLDDWMTNFLRGVRDNYVVAGGQVSRPQALKMQEAFDLCGV